MNDREILERFMDASLVISGSTDDVDLIEKEQTKLLDETETQLRSYYKQKLLEKMPKEKEFTFAGSEYLSEFSRGEKKGLYFGFNQALSQFKQIVEEVMG